MIYHFEEDEIEGIVRRFGKEFFDRLHGNISKYSDKWKLSGFRFIRSYSANCIFICDSELYGAAVMKMGNSGREIYTEFNTLLEYGGRRFCKVFDADIENGVILEECIIPGLTLRDENSLDKRLSVFSSLYKSLHIAPAQPDTYPAYTDWVGRITEYMNSRQDHVELYLHMKKAKEICFSINSLYTKKMLLHGDFHHDNILLRKTGEYVIIDPKGVTGDPVFDVPRFILNEFGDEINQELYKKINYIIYNLQEMLAIPDNILRQCLYVETTMGACWEAEDGGIPNYDSVIFAESIMNR